MYAVINLIDKDEKGGFKTHTVKDTFTEASEEARRLSEKYPGIRYGIFAGIGFWIAQNPVSKFIVEEYPNEKVP